MEQQVYRVTSVNNSGVMTAEEFHSCYPDITLRQMGTASESNPQIKHYRLLNTDSGGDSNSVIFEAQQVSIPTTIPVVYQQQQVPQQITIENVDPNGSVLVPQQQVVYTSQLSNGQVVIQSDNHSSTPIQAVLIENPVQRNNQNQAVQLTQVNSIDDNEQQQQQAHVVHYKGTTWTQIPGNQMKPRFETQAVVKNSANVTQKVVSQRCPVYSTVRRVRPVKKHASTFPSTLGQICPSPTLCQQLLPLSERVSKAEVSVETKPSGGAVQNKQPTQQRTQLFIILPNGEKRITSFDSSLHNLNVRDVIQHMDLPDTVKVVVNPEGSFCRENVPDTRETDDTTDHGVSKEEDEAPIYHEGHLAVCKPCGYTSFNFNRCDRCKRKFPSKCKTVPDKSIQLEKGVSRKTKCDNSLGPERKRSKGCKRKKPEEPVCLTISDDEDIDRSTSQDSPVKAPSHAELFPSDPNVTVCAMGKEPVITEEMETEYQEMTKGEEEEYGLDDLINNSPEECTLLQCRTVRIGSYKVVPRDQVLISHQGIKISVPAIDNSESIVEVKILFHEIVKVLIHFGRGLPVLFFYTTPSAAAKIRSILKMTSTDGFYYDPRATTEETHKRITLLPERIQDDDKVNLKTIFSGVNYYGEALLEELNSKEANDILVRASPKEVQNLLIKKSVPGSQAYNGQPIRMIMVYPPPPAKGGIPINTEDYACLGEDQFLNDVIIDFYLKYVMQNMLSEEDQARTHVFSSFFYKRLTTRPSKASRRTLHPIEDDPTVSSAVKRHSRVKNWTKNVNIFTKDFIIIPVNEHCHWFLAIICFPGLSGPVRMVDNTPITIPTKKKKQILESSLSNEIGPTVLTGKRTLMIGSTTITALVPSVPSSITVEGEDEDRDEADGDEEEMDMTSSSEDESVNNKQGSDPAQENNESLQKQEESNQLFKGKQREPIKQPCILIFDSLAGASRSKVAATLRDYLRIEYQVKHNGKEKDFSSDTMKGACPKVPQQTNYTDCGLYLLQYVETFFQKPIKDYRIPIKELQTWFTADIVSRKRYEIQQLLHRLMEEHNINIAELNLPVLDFSYNGEKRIVDYSGTEDEEEGEDEELEDEGECPEDEEELGELEETEMGEDEEEEGEEEMEEGEEMEDEAEEEEEEEEPGPEEELEEECLSQDEFPPFLKAPCKRKESVPVHLKSFRIPRLVKDSSSPEFTNVSKKLRADD